MAILGEPYKYDVFFSYSWALETGDDNLRSWSRRLVDDLSSLLKVRFGPNFSTFVDRDETKSAQEIEGGLERAVKQSGLFVAVMSDFYGSSNYCPKEAAWFCKRLVDEGYAIADHVCIIRIQRTPNDKWPLSFLDSKGSPLVYRDFCDASGQPIDIAPFMAGGSRPNIGVATHGASVEIADKFAAIKEKISARESYLKTQVMPDQPLFYLEAEEMDLERWRECGDILRGVPSIVLPARDVPTPATGVAENEYEGCDWVLMVRDRANDNFARRVKRAYLDLRKLSRDKKQPVRWALLDSLEEPPADGRAFKIPRIQLQGDWLKALPIVLC